MTVRVMIVDDHRIVLAGLRELIRHEPDMTVVGEAVSVRDAVRTATAVRPDVVLMDVGLPDGNGIEATRLIKARLPETQVLLLTVYEDYDTALKGVRAGAVGYVLKNVPPEHLMTAIRSVQSNGTMIHTIIARKLVEGTATAERRNGRIPLTEREVAVLREIAAGLSDKEIGSKLCLAEATVKTHVRSVYRKLGIRNRAQAVIYAVRKGLDGLASAQVHAVELGANGAKREDGQGIPALLGELIAARRPS